MDRFIMYDENGMIGLHEAVRFGKFSRICEILQRDPSRVHDRDNDHSAPINIVYLIRPGQEREGQRVLKILLDYGADPNSRSIVWRHTPLLEAIEFNQIEGVKLLLEHGADPNIRNSKNYTALHCAMWHKQNEVTEMLLEHGANVNAVTGDGVTPLDLAIYHGNIEKAQILMNAGGKARDIFNALDFQSPKCAERIIIFLIQHGAEISVDGQFSVKVLFFAWTKARWANFVEKVMREQGVDVDSFKQGGAETTELHVAAKSKNENQVRVLLETGADVNAKCVLGETPLHYLLDDETGNENRLYWIAKLLIEAGADLYARDCFGFSPFNVAVYRRYFRIINLMLSKISGVEENKLINRNSQNMWVIKKYHDVSRSLYPLAVAIILGYNEVVESLIEMGHHIEATCKTNNNKLPLCHAINYKFGVVKMLLEAGCETYGSYPSNVPNHVSHYPKVLKVLCLVWEYNCISILRYMITDGLRNIICFPIEYNIAPLVVFLYKLGLRSNRLNEDFISMTGVYNTNKKLLSMLASCDDQIDQLKNDLVCGNKSKFDLLTMKLDSFINFLNVESNLKAVEELRSSFDDNVKFEYDEEFESYKFVLKVRIDLAIEKKILLDSAKDCLNKVFQDAQKSLPAEILCNILSNLSIRELKKMSVED